MYVRIQQNERIKKIKENFVRQYGEAELENISSEVKNSPHTKNFLKKLDNKYFPTAEIIMETAGNFDYPKKVTISGLPQNIEKRIDYVHISGMILLEYWLKVILPYQDVNPISLTSNNRLNNEEGGWIFATQVIRDIFAKCDELEKQYNQ